MYSCISYHPVQCVPKNVSGCITMYGQRVHLSGRASDGAHDVGRPALGHDPYVSGMVGCESISADAIVAAHDVGRPALADMYIRSVILHRWPDITPPTVGGASDSTSVSPTRLTFYHRRGNLPGQLRGCALSLQRTTLRTSRHPAHRAHPNTPPALLARRPPSGVAIELC